MGTEGASTTGLLLHKARAYDALVWVLTRGKERRFRDHIVDLAGVQAGEAALDVGCGTGALAMAAKARVGPGGEVCGVDASPEMVGRARRKAAKAGLDIPFETAAVESLPFAAESFDVVFATLMLHHLTDDGRRAGVGEIARVLKRGGRLVAVDIAGGSAHGHAPFLGRGRHASFDLDRMEPVLDAAGLHVVDRGRIAKGHVLGMSNLRFLVAR